MTSRVLQLDLKVRRTLEGYLKDQGFYFSKVDHAFFSAKKDQLTVILYKSGKLVIQGGDVDLVIDKIMNSLHQKDAQPFISHIGTDESGKGDFFGPLVVAGVYVSNTEESQLRLCGVRDSKQLKDGRIYEIADKVRKCCVYDEVSIGPQRYNSLYEEIKNLNKLLSWAHARVIENLLEKVDCGLVISDQFGEKHFLLDRLMAKGRTIELVQKPRAEVDLAVAAASVLARSRYLEERKLLGEKYGFELPGGSGNNALEAAKSLVSSHGQGVLEKVAKVHFKTSSQIL
ncbi:MAG: ribonuclease HIII [Candidatus Altiarchaeota archaeon]